MLYTSRRVSSIEIKMDYNGHPSHSAARTYYNNDASGLTASTVQAAVDANATAIAIASAGSVDTSLTESTIAGINAGASLTTESGNTAYGANALRYPTGDWNTAIGDEALRGEDGLSTGGFNTAVGLASHWRIRSGEGNTGIGYSSGLRVTTGDGNVSIGRDTGALITTGSNNTFLGRGADGGITFDGQISIGYNARCIVANECVIGDASLTQIRPMGTCDLGTTANSFSELHVVNTTVYKDSTDTTAYTNMTSAILPSGYSSTGSPDISASFPAWQAFDGNLTYQMLFIQLRVLGFTMAQPQCLSMVFPWLGLGLNTVSLISVHLKIIKLFLDITVLQQLGLI